VKIGPKVGRVQYQLPAASRKLRAPAKTGPRLISRPPSSTTCRLRARRALSCRRRRRRSVAMEMEAARLVAPPTGWPPSLALISR